MSLRLFSGFLPILCLRKSSSFAFFLCLRLWLRSVTEYVIIKANSVCDIIIFILLTRRQSLKQTCCSHPPTQTFSQSSGGGLMCAVMSCDARHSLSTGRCDPCVGLPSSGQDVVYSCVLCYSPPYPATPQLPLVLDIISSIGWDTLIS